MHHHHHHHQCLRRCSQHRGSLYRDTHRSKAQVRRSRPGLDSSCFKCHSLRSSVGCAERLLQQSSMESQRYARRSHMQPLQSSDARPRSVSTTQVADGLLEAEAQLHIVLHVYRRLHDKKTAAGVNADVNSRLAGVTTPFRGRKTHTGGGGGGEEATESRAFLLSAHNKSTLLPKVGQHGRCLRGNAHRNRGRLAKWKFHAV